MMSRQHRDVSTKVDVATRDGGRDKGWRSRQEKRFEAMTGFPLIK